MGANAKATIEVLEEGDWRQVALFPSLPRDHVFFSLLSEGPASVVPVRGLPSDCDSRTREAWHLDGGWATWLSVSEYAKDLQAYPAACPHDWGRSVPWSDFVALWRAARAMEAEGEVRIVWWYDS